MGRILLFAILFFLGYLVLKSLGASLLKHRGRDDGESDSGSTELIQDPQCDIYFMKQHGIQARIGGQTFYFCSEACRDKYIEAHRKR